MAAPSLSSAVPAAVPTARPAAGAGSSRWVTALLEAVGLGPEAALEPARQRAWRGLAERPLPSRHDEAWRFTDTTALAAIAPQLLAAGAAAPLALPPAAAGVVRIVLDGGEDPLAGVSLPAGIELIPPEQIEALRLQAAAAAGGGAGWGEPEAGGSWIGLLAAAVAPRLLALRVRGAVAPGLELVSDSGAAAGVLPLRVLLLLEPGAELELLQVHRAAGASLTAVLLEARIGAGAKLRHGLVAQGAAASVLLADLVVRQEPGSEYSFSSAVAGWALSRLQPRVLQGAGAATTRLRALQRCDQRQIADHHSQVRFEGPEGELDQLHKAIAAGAGRSVFNGAVEVPRAAQRTNAVQLSRSLLLSDRARIDTKPQLEIVADDVKCAHGATVTRLQQEELFYLQSRGIDAAAAGTLLLRGFCAEVLRELPAAAAVWQPLAMLLAEEAPRP